MAAGYGAVLTVPAVRGAIAGSGATPARAVRDAVLTIPLTTVVPEEFAFRGVLFGLLGGNRRAAVASSVLFGLWHMLPALGDGPANATVGDIVGDDRRGVAVRTAGTVLVTAVGGLLMAEVRLRSGSLLAPVLLHWAVNGLGALVAALTGYLDSVGQGHHQDGQQGPDDEDAADPQREQQGRDESDRDDDVAPAAARLVAWAIVQPGRSRSESYQSSTRIQQQRGDARRRPVPPVDDHATG